MVNLNSNTGSTLTRKAGAWNQTKTRILLKDDWGKPGSSHSLFLRRPRIYFFRLASIFRASSIIETVLIHSPCKRFSSFPLV